MTTTDKEPNDIAAAEAAAKTLLDNRLPVIRKLAATNAERTRLFAALASVERTYTSDYVAAQHAGWSETELRKLGFAVPEKRPPGRPRGTRSTTSKTPPPAPATEQ